MTKVNIQRATQHVQSIRSLREMQLDLNQNHQKLRAIRDEKETFLKKL